jgi:hypothetical protein
MDFMSYEPPPVMWAEPGSFRARPDVFASLAEFGSADPRRLSSRERDVGLVWKDGDRLFRAAVVEATGELYVVQLGSPAEGGGHVVLLGVLEAEADLERIIEGWRVAQARPESFRWLRRRLERARGFTRRSGLAGWRRSPA